MATRFIHKGPTATGTGAAHGFSANDDGLIIHHNGEMFGVVNSDKIWPLTVAGAKAAPLYASGTAFVANVATAVDLQLPATKLGLKYTLYIGLAAAHKMTPVAADKFLQGAKTDGQALTGAAVGDSITVIGDGKDGWLVTSMKGTWT